MKFLIPNYSCLQNPLLGGYRPQTPVLSVLCPQLNLLNPSPRTKLLGTPLSGRDTLLAVWSLRMVHRVFELGSEPADTFCCADGNAALNVNVRAFVILKTYY